MINKKSLIKIFIVLIVFISFVSVDIIFSDIQPTTLKVKKKIPTNLKLKNMTVTGIIFEDGVYGRNVRRHFGMYGDRCKRIYISVPDNIANTINSAPLNFRKVKVTVSAGDYLKKGEASIPQRSMTALKVQFISKHTFTGNVVLVNCNDGYFDIAYRFCDYADFTMRVPVDPGECSRLNLQNNSRVSVTARGWTYFPRTRRMDVRRVVKILVHQYLITPR